MKRLMSVHSQVGAIVLTLAACATFAHAAGTASSDLIRRGQYLATAGDCVACHTAPGGKPYAGGLSITTPVGNIISTNITPSKKAGIGNYTLAQFAAALRKGVRADGQHLYPAMPYPSYANVTDDDVRALYAYFMHGVAPVDTAPPVTSLPFPFNIRFSMAAWNLLFANGTPFQPDTGKSVEWNRGAYLVRGLTHCGACHTPRNLLMAEESSRELAGGAVGAWYAPNITADPNSGIGGWTEHELVDYMRLGHASGKAQAAGPMAEAIDYSLRHLTEADLRAIAVFLKSVPAVHDPADTRPTYAWGAAADDLSSIRGVALPGDPNRMTGPQLYDAWCATCHQARGQGSFGGGLPSLFHNTTLGTTHTSNLVMTILEGVHRQTGSLQVRMPGFAQALSNVQIATLSNYLVQHYGNPRAKVTAKQVGELRSGNSSSFLIVAARAGIIVVAVLIVLILVFVTFRLRRRRGAR